MGKWVLQISHLLVVSFSADMRDFRDIWLFKGCSGVRKITMSNEEGKKGKNEKEER